MGAVTINRVKNAGAHVKELLATETFPELGPNPRPGTFSVQEIEGKLMTDEIPNAELVRSLVYLWHDHLEESHVIAQNIENRDGSYIHALMHRREPDYGNAKYWFRRVGKHPAYERLAQTAGKIITGPAKGLREQLLPAGGWDSFAFVDCCERAERSQDNLQSMLQQIQAEEFTALLDYLLIESSERNG